MENCVCSTFFFSSRRRHTRCSRDWSSDVCSSDLEIVVGKLLALKLLRGRKSLRRASCGHIQRGGLVRIFAVPQFLLEVQREVQAFGQARLLVKIERTTVIDAQSFHLHGNQAVVSRGGCKNFPRELHPPG